MGLALGTKFTAVLILPGFALGLAYSVLTRSPRPWRRLFLWAGSCLAGFIFLGAFNYVQDWRFYGYPFGPPENIHYQTSEAGPGDWRMIRANSARDIYSLMDFTGLPRPLADAAVRIRARAGREVFSALGLRGNRRVVDAEGSRFSFEYPRPIASEAGAFFGPLGFFLLLPVIFCNLIAGLIKRDGRVIPGLAFFGFLLAVGATQAWRPFRGRFYCAVITLAVPLVAGLFDSRRRRLVLRGLIGVTALITMTGTILTNVQKPLIGPQAIWAKTPEERRTLLWDRTFIPYRVLDDLIPGKAEVALILKDRDPEYTLFGERLSRKLVPIHPRPPVVDRAWLSQAGFRYVIVNGNGPCRVGDLSGTGYRVVDRPPYKIIIRS